MIHNLKRALVNNIKNISGWKTNRKLVVFESDDWGSLRIGSTAQLNNLVKAGILGAAENSYDRLDALECSEDMELLFEVLRAFKDKNGNPAVFTPFVNPCNPDFKKIAENHFNTYYYESFDQTLQRYGHHGVMDLYAKGIAEGLFMPEYHGREHIHVNSWMQALQAKDPAVIEGFKQEFASVNINPSRKFLEAFRPTYYFEDQSEIPFLKASIQEGAELFEQLFNYKTTVFDAPNAIFHPSLEETLHNSGIRHIVLPRFRSEPDGKGGLINKYYRFGASNQYGQQYHMRNCMFEPRINVGADTCLRMVQAAFRWGKPAVITTHRVNYMGGTSIENRTKGLKNLSALLKNILKTWPDAEFISSGNFAKLMRNS